MQGDYHFDFNALVGAVLIVGTILGISIGLAMYSTM